MKALRGRSSLPLRFRHSPFEEFDDVDEGEEEMIGEGEHGLVLIGHCNGGRSLFELSRMDEQGQG